ncbi:molybdopterin-dependent oxidoreductase [Desulfosarcina cetonica]
MDTTCSLCPGGCGISVRKVDNRAVKIEGKKGHPINDGGVCILGLSGLQMLYGPTRIKAPMKRIGERGEGKWQKISWGAAMEILSKKLGEIREHGEAHSVAAICGADQGTVPSLLKRFMTAYGSPNFICAPSFQDTDELAVKTLFGAAGRTGFDLENADYILSFGSGLADGWRSPVRMIKACSTWREKRVPVVQVEPRLSNSAAKANRWVPITPGTEADLALGIAAAMVAGNMAKSASLGNIKGALLANYAPEKVSQTTGVSVETITELAKAFAAANRPLALSGRGKALSPEGLRETQAIYLLNALAGNINQNGGMWAIAPLDYIQWANPASDKAASAGLRQPRLDGAGSGAYANANALPHRLVDAINSGSPYPLQALLVADANPCHSLHDTKAVKAAFEKIPFIVSFSSFNDETAAMADLLLPDHVYLERFEDVPVTAGLASQTIGLSKPVVSPQFNTRHLGETLICLARAMGGSLAASFPWADYETCLRETLAEKWDVLMKDGVWTAEQMTTAGSSFRAPALEAATIGVEGEASAFPLLLIPYDSLRISSGYIGDAPFMIKTVADTVIKGKDGFVDINPQTAAEIGLGEGSLALLTTPCGEASVRVHLDEGIMPGVIAMAKGLGHTAYDGYLADKGVNINELIGPVEDPSSGHDAAWGIRAKLAKA